MTNPNTRALPADMREDVREKEAAAHREELEAREAEARDNPVEFIDAGYDDTLPGQTEVVAGTVQHTQVLNSYPNATSYGPDHNVVVPEPEPPPEEGEGAARTEEEEEEQRRIAQQEQERMNDGR